jgi:hypothetical protein
MAYSGAATIEATASKAARMSLWTMVLIVIVSSGVCGAWVSRLEILQCAVYIV